MQDIVVDSPIGTSRDAAIAYAISVAKNADFPGPSGNAAQPHAAGGFVHKPEHADRALSHGAAEAVVGDLRD